MTATALLSGCALTDPIGLVGATTPVVNQEEAQELGLDPRFVQSPVGHEGEMVNDGWHDKVLEAEAVAGGDLQAVEDNIRELVLTEAGRDAQMLAIWAYAFGIHENPNDYADFLTEDKSYLSEAGIQKWNELATVLESTKILREEINEGYNSGVGSDGFGLVSTPGVPEENQGTVFYPTKGEPVKALDICGNFVFPSLPPNVPVIPPPPYLEPKDSSLDSVIRGNAPDGGVVGAPAANNPGPSVTPQPTPTYRESGTNPAPPVSTPGGQDTTPVSPPATGTTPGGGQGSVNPSPTPTDPNPGNTIPAPPKDAI